MTTPAVSGFGIGHQMKIYWDGRDHGAPSLPVSLESRRARASEGRRRSANADEYGDSVCSRCAAEDSRIG